MNRIIPGSLLVLLLIFFLQQLSYFLAIANGPNVPESARFSPRLDEVVDFFVGETPFYEQIAQGLFSLLLCEGTVWLNDVRHDVDGPGDVDMAIGTSLN